MDTRLRLLPCVLSSAMFATGGCDDEAEHDDHGHNESEIITTVTLSFAPDGGGTPVTASFRDPDGDGGMSGSAEPITLAASTTYTLSVEFLDELGDPALDITQEVAEEAEEHQVFVFGTAVNGPASAQPGAPIDHTYADLESNVGANDVGDDLPVGLTNTIVANAAGAGTLEVMLRHLPELGGGPQKVSGLAEDLAAGTALPGDVDANVSFDVTVE